MMKRITILTLSMLALSAASAQASCDGLYLGGRVGIVSHNIGDGTQTIGSRDKSMDNVLALSGAIGYRFKSYWRAELEYLWRGEIETNPVKGADITQTFQTTSYMANLFYDFSPYTMFTPYVMGGIGMTNVRSEESGAATLGYEKSANNFTWSLGGGLSAKMTNRWNIDLGYRFFNMGALDEARIRAHEVYLGTRYVF